MTIHNLFRLIYITPVFLALLAVPPIGGGRLEAADQPAAYVRAFRHAEGLEDFARAEGLTLHTWDLSNGEWAILIKPARYPAEVAFYDNPNFEIAADGSFKVDPNEAIETLTLNENEAYVICPAHISEGRPNVLISVSDESGFYTWAPAFSGLDGSLIATKAFAAIPAENSAVKNFADFTAEVPEQWEAHDNSPWVGFIARDKSGEVNIVIQQYELADADWLARALAARFEVEEAPRRLPDGQGFTIAAHGKRYWTAESGGWSVTVFVSGPHRDLPALLGGCRSRRAGLAEIFTGLANSQTVMDWLTFKDGSTLGSPLPPNPPVKPDFARYGFTAGENGPIPALAQAPPEGWTHRNIGAWIVLESLSGRQWAAARYYPLAAGDRDKPAGAPLTETAREVAAKLGGRNLKMEEGVIYFATPAGAAALSVRNRHGGLVTIYSDSGAELELFDFIAVESYE